MHTRKPPVERSERSADAGESVDRVSGEGLWWQFLSRPNLAAALDRIEANRGAPGVDGLAVEDLREWLQVNGRELLGRLGAGDYEPLPVRRVMIPKPGGGERMLGIPSVVDRFVQQALAQVLVPVFDPGFSSSSYGFRPGRSAHDAVRAGRRAIESGRRWVVDIDLEKFFDRVNHDMLMARVARKVDDKQVLRLVRAYLNAGIMADGVLQPVEAGVPQGSPLSPLLSNVMLDDLDRELTGRGLVFCRYADDIRIFVASKRAAERVMGSVFEFVEGRLKLRVNAEKSSVQPASRATMLGFGFT